MAIIGIVLVFLAGYVASYIIKLGMFQQNLASILPPEISYQFLFDDFKEIRERWGKAIPISSGYRCPKHQLELYKQEISTTPYSAHILGLALDLQCKSEKEVLDLVRLIKDVNPSLRIGYKRYLYRGQYIIHIDNAYLMRPRFSEKLLQGVRW